MRTTTFSLAAMMSAAICFTPGGADAQPTPPPAPPAEGTAPAPAPTTRQIGGRVVDAGGAPIAGATVTVTGTSLSATTDADGLFVLAGVAATEVELQIAAPGLAPVATRVAADVTTASIALENAKPAARTIRGKVTDAQGEIVAGAMVQLPGSETLAFTDENGRFELTNVPADAKSLNVEAAGYRNIPLPITDGELHAVMPRAGGGSGGEGAPGEGEEIFIEGRAPVISKENKVLGASVVDGRDLNRVSSQTLDGALSGKVAGANIQSNSGAPGGGTQLRLRGISTLNGQSSPLYVVDGVILSNSAIPSGANSITNASRGNTSSVQDNPVNRIADINPNDIDSVEILKGASAAALYGSKASNGVVIITTKRGKAGEARVEVTQRVGLSQVSKRLGSRRFNSAAEVMEATGDEDLAALWTPTVYDHEKEMTQTPLAYETIASASGGTKVSNYSGSILVRDEPGVVKGTFYEKQSGRLSVGYKLGDVRIGLSGNVIHSKSDRGITNNDNTGTSLYMALAETPSFLNLNRNPDGSYPINVAANSNPLETVALVQNEEDVWRAIGAANADWKVWSNQQHAITLRGNFGLDRFEQNNSLLSPPQVQFEDDDGLLGTSIDMTANSLNYNLNTGAVWTFTPTSNAWKSALSAGVTYEVADRKTLYLVGKGLNPFQPSPQSAESVQPVDGYLETRDQGFYVQEEVELFDERLSVLGALLAERSSLNGDTNHLYLFPKLAAAYKLPVAENTFDTLRVRAAYGETGNRPTLDQKFTTLDADNTIGGNNGLIIGTIAGDAGIEPERQREIEVGADAILPDQRLALEVSVYQRSISNLLLQRTLAGSTGFTSKFENGGGLRNRGVDLTVSALPVPGFDWKTSGTFTMNRSEITDLPFGPHNAIGAGFGASYGSYRLEEGKSATQIVSDVDGDGILDVVGNGEPDFRVGWANELSVGPVGLFTLVDWQQGSDVINMTRNVYDTAKMSADFTTDGMERLATFEDGDLRPYVEDASFVKLREISLSYAVPGAIARQLGPLDRMSVSLSGRNLYTFTNYSGLDPEVSNFGNQPLGRNYDLAPYPPSRSYWLSVTAGF